MKQSPKGFIEAPTLAQLRPTKREQHLLAILWHWQEASRHSRIVLGQPLKEQINNVRGETQKGEEGEE